jgi:hypothetical protein
LYVAISREPAAVVFMAEQIKGTGPVARPENISAVQAPLEKSVAITAAKSPAPLSVIDAMLYEAAKVPAELNSAHAFAALG